MAFETEHGNVTKPDATISAFAAEAFVEVAKAPAHCRVVQLANLSTVKFNKDGSFVAGTVTESGAYSYDAGDEFTQTSVPISALTFGHIYKPTIQAERFGDGQMDLQKLGRLQAEALARAIDAVWLTLFGSITNTITATSTLTKDNLIDSQYTVHNAMNRDNRLHVMLARKGRNEIRKEITSISADAFSQPGMTQLFDRSIQPNGLVGEFSDMLVFNTSGLPTTGGDNQQAVYDPQLAFGMVLDSQVYTRSVFVASGGFFTENGSWVFANVGIYNQEAACKLRSDS